jgi:hypothetical protein
MRRGASGPCSKHRSTNPAARERFPGDAADRALSKHAMPPCLPRPSPRGIEPNAAHTPSFAESSSRFRRSKVTRDHSARTIAGTRKGCAHSSTAATAAKHGSGDAPWTQGSCRGRHDAAAPDAPTWPARPSPIAFAFLRFRGRHRPRRRSLGAAPIVRRRGVLRIGARQPAVRTAAGWAVLACARLAGPCSLLNGSVPRPVSTRGPGPWALGVEFPAAGATDPFGFPVDDCCAPAKGVARTSESERSASGFRMCMVGLQKEIDS